MPATLSAVLGDRAAQYFTLSLMDRPNKKNILLYILWGIVIILLIIVIVFSFIIREKIDINLFLEFLGISAMLAIALQTFLEMNKSTEKTIKTVSDTSQKQIEELKKTNIVLTSVSESLKIVSEDIIIKNKQNPNLFLTFKKNQKEINLIAGKECEIEFWLHNSGPVSANHTYWKVFFPPEIKIVNKGDFNSQVQQTPGTRFVGCVGLFRHIPVIQHKSREKLKTTIETESTDNGLVEISFSCSCNGVPEKLGKLSINLLG